MYIKKYDLNIIHKESILTYHLDTQNTYQFII